MSKDKKKFINLPVETVENYQKMTEYMFSTLEFWKIDEWPCNLVIDGLKSISQSLYIFLEENNNEAPF